MRQNNRSCIIYSLWSMISFQYDSSWNTCTEYIWRSCTDACQIVSICMRHRPAWSRCPNNARTKYGVWQLEIHHPKLEPLNRWEWVWRCFAVDRGCTPSWLGSPTVRLVPASMLICKTVIGILELRMNYWIGLDSSGVLLSFICVLILCICALWIL
jgi:hypothetical protein